MGCWLLQQVKDYAATNQEGRCSERGARGAALAVRRRWVRKRLGAERREAPDVRTRWHRAFLPAVLASRALGLLLHLHIRVDAVGAAMSWEFLGHETSWALKLLGALEAAAGVLNGWGRMLDLDQHLRFHIMVECQDPTALLELQSANVCRG